MKLEIPQLETPSSDQNVKESTKIEKVWKIDQNQLRKLKTDSYLSNETLIAVKSIKEIVLEQIRWIEPRKGKVTWNDIFKTKISRAACRLGLELVYRKESKLVKISDYKSGDYSRFFYSF